MTARLRVTSARVDQEFVVGPADHLVLVSKGHLTMQELQQMIDRIPEALRGRVLIVDGTTMDAKVVRDA